MFARMFFGGDLSAPQWTVLKRVSVRENDNQQRLTMQELFESLYALDQVRDTLERC